MSKEQPSATTRRAFLGTATFFGNGHGRRLGPVAGFGARRQPFADGFLAARFDFGNDREAVVGRGLRKDRADIAQAWSDPKGSRGEGAWSLVALAQGTPVLSTQARRWRLPCVETDLT